MPKSLSEMRQSPDVGLPERTHRICVAGKLQAELDRLDRRLVELEVEAETAQADERPGRLGDTSRVAELQERADQIAAEADEVRDKMEDHTVDLLLRAKPGGEWRQWCAEHPADEDTARDQRGMAGVCSADALRDALEGYVVQINGETPSNGDWDFIVANAASRALDDLARTVLEMHETVADLGKSRRVWLNGRRTQNDSE